MAELDTSAGGSLLKKYLKFAATTVASLLVYSLYSIVDGLFVSWGINEYAMSSVNLALPFTNILFSIAMIFALGSSTIIAIHLGRKNPEKANAVFTQNTVTLLVIGVAVTALVFIFLDPFTRLLGAEGVTYEYTKSYLTGLAPFAVCFIVSYNMEILIKTDGYPQKAFFTVIAGCLMNCLLDYIAIFPLKMGVFGAALATGLSQLFVCIIYALHFLRGKTTFGFVRFKFDFKLYKKLIPLGLPDGVAEACAGLMLFLFNRIIASTLGADGLVSYTIIAYINTLVINTLAGVSQGAQPLISYHHGAENEKNCRKLLKYALVVVAVCELIIFAILRIFGNGIVELFIGTENPALNAASFDALSVFSLAFLVIGFNIVIGGYLTAREHAKSAFILSVCHAFVFQAASLIIISVAIGGTAIWFSPLIGEALCLILSILLLMKKTPLNSKAQ